jgi:hypothetical protein
MKRIAILLVAACGSPSGTSGALDCAWLASNNCWKQAAAAAEACLPPSNEVGTLSTDAMTCTYASGDVVTSPASLLSSSGTPNLTVTHAGQTCLHFESGGGMVTLGTSAGTVYIENDGTTVTVSCPDGSRDSSPAQSAFRSCLDGAVGEIPGHQWNLGGSETRFWLDGTSVGKMQVYDCHT